MEDYSKYFENLISNGNIEESDTNRIKAENSFYRYELDCKNSLIQRYQDEISTLVDKNIKLETANKNLKFCKYYAIASIIFEIISTISYLFEIIFK